VTPPTARVFARPEKVSKNKFLQLIGCAYICNQKVAHMMRRDVFQAVADPTRRNILSLLASKAMTPNDIADHFDTSRQAVSKHLQILAECHAIDQRRTGREIYYYFNPKKMKEIDQWLDPFRKLWEDRLDQLDNILKDL
jgi:DNA-binding transcriptional ArsR family regulator